MDRVVLVGGSGFIGRHVTRWLVKAGADVSVVHRGRTPALVPGARTLLADRNDPAALQAALMTADPSVVIDMTAYTGSDAERLVAALPDAVRRLVVVSSGDVYWTYGVFLGLSRPEVAVGSVDEDSPLREQLYPYRRQAGSSDDLLYHYDKILVERTARIDCKAPVTILRLPMVYGPGDRQNRVGGYLARLAASGGTLRLNSDEASWRCTRGYVEDVAGAIGVASLNELAAGQTFNVGERDALTELEWIEAIAEAAGWSGQVIRDPETPATRRGNWTVPLMADTSHIRAVLGFEEPVGREEGVRRTVAS